MDDERLTELLAQYAKRRDEETLSRAVTAFLPLSRAIARRFAGQGVEVEDLEQVAAMALVKAVQRFEAEHGLRFTTYAAPTIAGEVRNFLRDRGGAIRMGRDTRTMLARLQKETEKLEQRLQRSPTLKELAAAMAISYDELLRLLDARESAQVTSLHEIGQGEEALALEEKLGAEDPGFSRVEDRSFYEWAMAQLNPKERQMAELRFVRRLGQRDTAKAMGVSQMQVSRMERRMLEKLRRLTSEG